MVYLIKEIRQLDVNNKHNIPIKNLPEKDNKQIVINRLEQLHTLFVQNDQQKNTPVWPTMLQPTNLKQAHVYPQISCKIFILIYFQLILFSLIFYLFLGNSLGYDNLERITTAKYSNSKHSQILSNLTIISQEMEGAVSKWLHYLKLHKYQWFFDDLSYLEIEFIDEDNIEGFIAKVNKNSITKGAQKKICISTKALRDRQQKFKDLLMVSLISSNICFY